MATISATITVDFTANFAGDHRVCFRIQGSGDVFDCSTIVNCVGGATACQAIIVTTVNSTSCDGTVTFEGYVQATCEDVLSLNGRLDWTADFIPNPICDRFEIACDYGAIDSIAITVPGQEYLVSDTLTAVRQVGDTKVADAILSIATVGDGVINTVTGILAAGAGYTALDVLTVVDGGATGSGATIRVDTIGGSGEILTFTLLTNGTDYIGPFTFTGGTGTAGTFTITSGGVDYDVFGTILTLTITDGGEYQIIPVITITTGTGSLAVLDAHLEDCAAFSDIGLDCSASAVHLDDGLVVDEFYATCMDPSGVTGSVPDRYIVTETGCCIPADTDLVPNTTCVDYHIENQSGGPITVQYTACGGIETLSPSIADTVTLAVCAVNGGVIDLGLTGVTITNLGTPCT